MLVPEETLKGRLYGLTPTGQDVVWDVFRSGEAVSFTTVTREAFPYDDPLSFLIDHAGTALRGVVSYTREAVTMYVHIPEQVNRAESTVAETLSDVATDVLAETPNRLDDKVGSLTYAVQRVRHTDHLTTPLHRQPASTRVVRFVRRAVAAVDGTHLSRTARLNWSNIYCSGDANKR
ncbi:hypothetical protein [Haladaptatus sp. DJG-WS-42]|uniref:hypothetical protein n=1 Tax=Haladaptatus sp. DJG-WS-42 TaxID=3120516 RepID=UPI0030CA8B4E